MPQAFGRLRLVALNIDGVLLGDSFGPVIRSLVTGCGVRYTAEIEGRVLSQPRRVASRELCRVLGWELTDEEMAARYFAARERYLAEHPLEVTCGALDLVRRVRSLGLATVCYGGLGREHFEEFFGAHAELFDGPGYVCTDGFRPGIREITAEVFGLSWRQVVFVDDVARVGEQARDLGVAFIGFPGSGSFQGEAMRRAGVRHVVDRLDAIDERLLRVIDAECEAGACWPGGRGRRGAARVPAAGHGVT